MNQEAVINALSDRLNALSARLKSREHSATVLEGVCHQLFDALFGWQLCNLNQQQYSFPAVDLGDTTHRIAIQITVQDGSGKATHTLAKIDSASLRQTYQCFICFFLIPQAPGSRSPDPADFYRWGIRDFIEGVLKPLHLSAWLKPHVPASHHIFTLARLQQALHILDETLALPLPLPQDHQPVCNLPLASIGSLFKGRDDFLRDLRATLTGGLKKAAAIVQGHGAHGTRPAAITALGGVGKTRTAIEYGWQHAHDYDALLFVSAATPQLLKDQIAALSGALVPHLADQLGTDVEKQYAAALQWLHDHPRWFLILDNADTDDALRAVTDLLARLTHGHVCITTRISQWPDSVQPLDLQVLTDAAGADYLIEATHGQRATASDDETQARALSHRLDGLALALEHAAAYIKKLRLSFRDYLSKLESNAATVLGWHDDKTVQYPKSVAETWLITFEKLSADERELLNILSWLDPAPIPVWLVGGLPELSTLNPQLSTSPDPRELLAGLAAWHLITWSDDAQSFKVHRLVQEVTRLRLKDKEEQKRKLDMALDWLEKADLGDPQNPDTWPRGIPCAPHALRLADHAELQQQWDFATRWRNNVAILHKTRGQYGEALRLFRSALLLAETHLPFENSLRSKLLVNLAYLLGELGQHTEAEPLARRALVIAEETHGSEHPEVAHRLNILAELLRAINRMREAEPLFRRALDINEKTFGPEHQSVANCLNNLALLLRSLNSPSEAEPLFRRALAIDEKVFGPEHPSVATCLNNLALLLRGTHRITEAEPLFRRALAIEEKTFGLEHPSVAISLNGLAVLLDNSGRKVEAEPMYRRALAIDEKIFGPEHPRVAMRLYSLASVMHELGRSRNALPLVQRAVGIFQHHGEQHGYVHPELDAALSWLEEIQQAAGSS